MSCVLQIHLKVKFWYKKKRPMLCCVHWFCLNVTGWEPGRVTCSLLGTCSTSNPQQVTEHQRVLVEIIKVCNSNSVFYKRSSLTVKPNISQVGLVTVSCVVFSLSVWSGGAHTHTDAEASGKSSHAFLLLSAHLFITRNKNLIWFFFSFSSGICLFRRSVRKTQFYIMQF